jgi:hypothetical protein
VLPSAVQVQDGRHTVQVGLHLAHILSGVAYGLSATQASLQSIIILNDHQREGPPFMILTFAPTTRNTPASRSTSVTIASCGSSNCREAAWSGEARMSRWPLRWCDHGWWGAGQLTFRRASITAMAAALCSSVEHKPMMSTFLKARGTIFGLKRGALCAGGGEEAGAQYPTAYHRVTPQEVGHPTALSTWTMSRKRCPSSVGAAPFILILPAPPVRGVG